MKIRQLLEDEIEICSKIYSSVFINPPYYNFWPTSQISAMLAGLYSVDPEHCWCIEVDDEIIGFAFCTVYGSFRATIHEFAIKTEMQGKGFGSALMDYMLAEFKQAGIAAVDLCANKDAKAYKLYKKFGFGAAKNYRIMIKEV